MKNLKGTILTFVMILVLLASVSPSGMVEAQAATSVSISKKKATLSVGEKLTLSLKGAKGSITWASSKPKVAKITKSGKVTALKAGKATITAICSDKSYTCKITVVDDSELSAKEIYELCHDGVVEVNAGASLGSGFFIKKKTVVTNYHVIDDATSLTIKTLDDEEYDVLQVLGYSEELDLAILKVDLNGTPIAFNTHGLTMGETTYTIGSSLGLTNTFSNGMISNTSRNFNGVEYIQTNTAISHGNSGGPLINAYGEVIGVTTAFFTEGQNLNLAINISELDKVDTDSPMSVKEFLNRKSKSNSKGNVGGNSKGKSNDGTEPSLDAIFLLGEPDGQSYACAIGIINYSSKPIKIGSSISRAFALVYPSPESDYVAAYPFDEETFEPIDTITIEAGESKTIFFALERPAFIDEDESAVTFVLKYDGVEYFCMTGPSGSSLVVPYQY